MCIMKKFASNRKGFTLVELLIVIVVIGILSAMMMLSSSEAVATAKATVIISDLRNLKTAALAYFADNVDTYLSKTAVRDQDEISTRKNSDKWDKIMTYLNGKDFPRQASYKLIPSDNTEKDKAWFVECDICGDSSGSTISIYGKDGSKNRECIAVKKKLAGRAKSVGLLAGRTIDLKPYDAESGYSKGDNVFMLVQ
ncbi:MAG: type II secretion system protein [Synergistaceae bacterium]|nr:type II secretion system protein [Synergistaceae bacterium]